MYPSSLTPIANFRAKLLQPLFICIGFFTLVLAKWFKPSSTVQELVVTHAACYLGGLVYGFGISTVISLVSVVLSLAWCFITGSGVAYMM